MAKKIDLTRTVFELTKEYPELIDLMAKLGFTEITKKPVLHSVGKIMTIPKGAKMKNISMAEIAAALMKNGFELTGEFPESSMPEAVSETQPAAEAGDRTGQLKAYLRRLGAGEDLESVRTDFVREFEQVDAAEIMKAEQELMKEGTPLSEVQKLCDIHSALFHGATREEQIANAEKAVEQSLQRQNQEIGSGQKQKTGAESEQSQTSEQGQKQRSGRQEHSDARNARAAALEEILGHPLQTLTRENQAFSALLDTFRSTEDASLLSKIRELSIHYAKKGDLLYPLLKVKYDISGPSDVMWTVDDEIRDELRTLESEEERGDAWQARVEAVLKRAEEMVYKEQNILFPICADNFTEEEWKGIYRDAKDYAVCFGVESEVWSDAEKTLEKTCPDAASHEGEVVMPGGHMTVDQLTALLNTIPMEITFVDADNINRFFNEGPKVFKRPGMAIDREVFSCHPPKIEPMVRQIIEDFRNGRQDCVPIWMEKGGRTMLVKYMAVRDAEGNYVGTAEFVQDMEFAKEHFGSR